MARSVEECGAVLAPIVCRWGLEGAVHENLAVTLHVELRVRDGEKADGLAVTLANAAVCLANDSETEWEVGELPAGVGVTSSLGLVPRRAGTFPLEVALRFQDSVGDNHRWSGRLGMTVAPTAAGPIIQMIQNDGGIIRFPNHHPPVDPAAVPTAGGVEWAPLNLLLR